MVVNGRRFPLSSELRRNTDGWVSCSYGARLAVPVLRTGVLDRGDCRIMTGVANEFRYEGSEPEKPGGSPEGSDCALPYDEATADVDIPLPRGVSGGDHRERLRGEDDDVEFGGLSESEEDVRDVSPIESVPDDDLFGEVPPPDGLDEGAADRAELRAWLTKFFDADDRAFEPSELADIRREIEALHAKVGTMMELNRQQKEAIQQLLAEVQSGSERMGRKDWVTYGIGVATSLVIMEIVPPLVLLPLAVHAIHALGHLLILDA